jgi:hypothetical protein
MQIHILFLLFVFFIFLTSGTNIGRAFLLSSLSQSHRDFKLLLSEEEDDEEDEAVVVVVENDEIELIELEGLEEFHHG